MKLKELISDLNITEIFNQQNPEIKELSNTYQSKMDNALFFCYVGAMDGHDYIKKAINNGAVAFIVEKINRDIPITQIKVKNCRKAMSELSKKFYCPEVNKAIKIIGITGTNGKTTTSFLLAHTLNTCGYKTGIIGTEGIFYDGKTLERGLTTPDPIYLFKVLGDMLKCGIKYVAMEVSAHAIDLKKVSAITFYRKILTNITQDHLDYFKTFENYSKTKLSFFDDSTVSIINADDPQAKYFYDKPNVKTYGLKNPSDCFAVEVEAGGSSFYINIMDKVAKIQTPLKCEFNVYNIMAAGLCACSLGVSLSKIAEALKTAKTVDGRMNLFIDDRNRKIVVDFAHTPDGLKNILTACKQFTANKLVCLFGCGGNRDAKKRPIMGKIAEVLSDYVILTSDNPRFENPNAIIQQIADGMNKNNHKAISDRAEAIKYADSILKYGDTLVICGKGAEPYQDYNGVKVPYSDFDEVNKIFNAKRIN